VSGLRLPLRLARREVRRRPGRTALVALLIALPVAGMVLATVTIHTGRHTPAEKWEQRNGQAEAVGYDAPSDVSERALPDGARSVTVESTYFRSRTPDGLRSDIELSDLPLLDPLTAGIHELSAGRAPSERGEVAVSPTVARRLHVGVGDDLVLERPDLELTVVGLIDPVACLGCPHAVVAPGAIPAALSERYGANIVTLVDLPEVSSAELDALRGEGLELRVDTIAQPAGGTDHAVQWSLVLGAIALTVVGIVISAAFAVGARRQLVTLGQLSASGASPTTVRLALVLQGTVTGLLGAVTGLVLAAVVLLSGRGIFEGLLDERIHRYAVSASDVAWAMLIGVGAATVAALLPARTAARIPTLAALAGRRPLAPVSRRLLVGGVAAMAAGLGLLGLAVVGSRSGGDGDLWALVASIGGVGELLGACAIAPAVVARLEPLAHRLRGALRLGARSLARNRARTGAVVSAVAAAGALAVAAGALVLGGTAGESDEPKIPDDVVVLVQEGYDDATGLPSEAALPPADALRDARALLPGAQEITLEGTTMPDDVDPGSAFWGFAPDPSVAGTDAGDLGALGGQRTAGPLGGTMVGGLGLPSANRAIVADDAVLDAIHADDALREALRESGLVVLTPFGNVPLLVTPPGASEAVPGRSVHHRYGLGYTAQLLISQDEVDALGLDTAPSAVAFRTPSPITEAQRDGLEDLQYDNGFNDRSSALTVQWAYHRDGPTPLQVELILSGIALVFSLFVVGVSLALAAAESKDERDILTIAGAPPGALARSAGARAWLLASIGGAMAIPVGFLPVIVFSYASHDQLVDERFPLVFPGRTALMLVLVVPAVVAAVSFASSAAAQRLHPVRVSTATFE
jgi:putative ABC transport system permease protein